MVQRKGRRWATHAAMVVALICVMHPFPDGGGRIQGQPQKIDVLKIGNSGSLMTQGQDRKKEEAGLETLRDFIKDETKLNNEITTQKNWQELAQKLAKGELHLGVFPGYEFAWARQEFPKLKPLVLTVNVHRYPVVSIVAKKDKGPKDFAALQGQTIAIPANGQSYLKLFVEHLTKASAKPPAKFFAKIASPENIEDAMDDVVDGKVQAAAVDEAALDAFKRRKPGRFNQLVKIASSQPLPPAVIAYYDSNLGDDMLKQFSESLLRANTKERGQTLLTLFHLTGFQPVPDDFAKVLTETRKTYPPPSGGAKK